MFFRYKTLAIKKHFQNYFIFYFTLVLAFIIGIVIGPLIIKKTSYNMKIFFLKLSNPYFKSYYLNKYTKSSVLKASIINNIFLVIIIIILGLINPGMFFIPIFVALKGIFIGYTVAFLVESFGIKGFLSSVIGIYPQNIFIIGGLIGIGAVSMSICYSIKKPFINKPFLRKNININEYLGIILIFALMVIFGSLIEGIISPKILKIIVEPFV